MDVHPPFLNGMYRHWSIAKWILLRKSSSNSNSSRGIATACLAAKELRSDWSACGCGAAGRPGVEELEELVQFVKGVLLSYKLVYIYIYIYVSIGLHWFILVYICFYWFILVYIGLYMFLLVDIGFYMFLLVYIGLYWLIYVSIGLYWFILVYICFYWFIFEFDKTTTTGEGHLV